tara:strand:+ start:591 stop:977 length:387 start_codon:yes stop_codon:yes gene_type:complete
MASELRVTTIANNAGTESVDTTYVINGTAKAWVNFNGAGTVAIRESNNTSSITDNGTGNYTVNFTSAMEDVNYSLTGLGTWNTDTASGGLFATQTSTFATTSARIYVYQSNSLFNGIDSHTCCVNILR